MKKFIDLMIEKTSWVNGFTIAIAVAGVIALWGMKRDLTPPFKFNYVEVDLTYRYGSAEEIERLITYPIEENLRTIPDLEEITSRTRVGGASITLKFPQSVKPLSEKIEEVRSRIQSQMTFLPSDIRDISVTQQSDNENWVASLAIEGLDDHNWEHHKFYEAFKNKIMGVPGIINVGSTLKPYHVFIRFDKDKLSRNGVTVGQIRQAVQEELQGNVMGYNYSNGKEWLLEFSQKAMTPDQIKNLPLYKNTQGHGLTLGDVADVGFDMERNAKYHFLLNGKKAIEMWIMKTHERDAMETFADVKKVIQEFEKPKGITVDILYDGPYFIQQQISVLLSNGVGGLALVLLMLAFAMGWKSSLMTAIGLPISYFGTFLILRFLGISIDLISLIAMILVVGNLVDDAVIFADMYNQLLQEGMPPKEAASKAARDLIVPVTGTISTIICAFLPIILVDSELSIVFFAIPIVIAVSLFLSWFETFFILPNHLNHYVKKPAGEKATVFFHFLARGYKKALRHTLKFRYLYAVGVVALLGFTLYTASKMPQDFSISINAPQVELFVTFKDEIPFDDVIKALEPLHKTLTDNVDKKDLAFIETNLGWVHRQGKTYRGPKYATVRLSLNRADTDTAELRERVRIAAEKVVAEFKEPRIQEIVTVASQRGEGSRRKDIASVEIRGRDENSFREARNELAEKLAGKGNVGESVPPDNPGPTTYHFIADRESMRAFQIPRSDFAFQVQAQTGSVELVQTRDSGRWMSIYLEPQGLHEPTVEDLSNLKIQSPIHGEMFSIRNLGKWVPSGHSEAIEHKASSRILTMDFRFDGKKTNEQVVKAELAELIKPVAKKYPGLEISAVDANAEDKAGREWTLKVILGAAVLIYLILALTLRSWTQPLIVGLPIPFALVGVVWALKLHDEPLGLMAMIGLIGTMGVAVNDSIVMVHFINGLTKQFGKRTAELIIDGAATRLRAIFLTASCTLVGVFPTAYGIGGESGFTQPLAFSMGWGLSASLLLTLFIIPAMLMVFDDLGHLTTRLLNRRRARAVAPVIQRVTHPAQEPLPETSAQP